uniref:tRNA (adenine(58)-N(1))-methyltransferase non-catalytic subunit TRM6 n=1 Tax=Entomoneis paludosa TaxID=265537 RepID=A0A7S2YLH2_9STRA
MEAADRDAMTWPCALQDHTRRYLQSAELCPPKHEARRTEKQEAFLEKRYARFTRKLTRPSPQECASNLKARPCDSLLLVIRQYDIQETLEGLLPYLAPSCPLVIFCEYLEPLTQCFQWLQDNQLAIHLHLMSTWTREYQVLPGRTHPAMNMSQNGGFVLTGIKLDTELGRNQEPDEETLQEIRASLPTRRGKKRAPISEGHQKKKDRKVLKTSGDTRESNGKTATR